MSMDMTKVEKLIWSFLFTDKVLYEIDIDQYCKSSDRANFRDNIRDVIKKGGKKITEDRIVHFEEKVIWKIEISI